MSYCVNGMPLRVRLTMCVMWYAAWDCSAVSSCTPHDTHSLATTPN